MRYIGKEAFLPAAAFLSGLVPGLKVNATVSGADVLNFYRNEKLGAQVVHMPAAQTDYFLRKVPVEFENKTDTPEQSTGCVAVPDRYKVYQCNDGLKMCSWPDQCFDSQGGDVVTQAQVAQSTVSANPVLPTLQPAAPAEVNIQSGQLAPMLFSQEGVKNTTGIVADAVQALGITSAPQSNQGNYVETYSQTSQASSQTTEYNQNAQLVPQACPIDSTCTVFNGVPGYLDGTLLAQKYGPNGSIIQEILPPVPANTIPSQQRSNMVMANAILPGAASGVPAVAFTPAPTAVPTREGNNPPPIVNTTGSSSSESAPIIAIDGKTYAVGMFVVALLFVVGSVTILVKRGNS